MIFCSSGLAQSLLIDHSSVASFDSIPEEYKQAASDLRMLFMDRSVGGNISFYLDCLSNLWTSAPSACKRYQHQDSIYAVDPAEVYWDRAWDRSMWKYAYWPSNCSEDVTCFIDYMSYRLDSFDVMGCQFSYLAVAPGSQIADPVSGFFGSQGDENKASMYNTFAEQHPDKKVIWWTTSLARSIGTTESEAFNAQMRTYAATHDIILFDVADILSHDPEGNPCYDNRDGVTYKDEAYPDDSLAISAICPQYTTETDGGHLGSISAGGIRVSKAFWVLMARLAGWPGGTTSIDRPVKAIFKLFPNPTSGTLQVHLDPDKFSDQATCFVFDLQGQCRMNFRINPASAIFNVDVKTLPAGMYFFQIRTKDIWETNKFLVQ